MNPNIINKLHTEEVITGEGWKKAKRASNMFIMYLQCSRLPLSEHTPQKL